MSGVVLWPLSARETGAEGGGIEFITGGLRGVLTADTRCADCNRRFIGGEEFTAQLAADPRRAVFRHAGPCPLRRRRFARWAWWLK